MILLPTFDDDEVLPKAIEAGTDRHPLKDRRVERLGAAIHSLVAGGSVTCTSITERVLDITQTLVENAPSLRQLARRAPGVLDRAFASLCKKAPSRSARARG